MPVKQVTEQKPPSRRRHEPLGNGLHRTVTGSSLSLADLQTLTEKAQEQECPKTPSSLGGRTPRSNSGLSLTSGSRASSIVQACPLTSEKDFCFSCVLARLLLN